MAIIAQVSNVNPGPPVCCKYFNIPGYLFYFQDELRQKVKQEHERIDAEKKKDTKTRIDAEKKKKTKTTSSKS